MAGSEVDITQRRQSEERRRLLAEITSQLLASDHQQRIVETICHRVMDHLNCDMFLNYLLDEAQDACGL